MRNRGIYRIAERIISINTQYSYTHKISEGYRISASFTDFSVYTEDSDIDVYLETSKPSMFAMVHIKEDLQDLFGCRVDLVRLREHMDSFLRSRIEKEGIYV